MSENSVTASPENQRLVSTFTEVLLVALVQASENPDNNVDLQTIVEFRDARDAIYQQFTDLEQRAATAEAQVEAGRLPAELQTLAETIRGYGRIYLVDNADGWTLQNRAGGGGHCVATYYKVPNRNIGLFLAASWNYIYDRLATKVAETEKQPSSVEIGTYTIDQLLAGKSVHFDQLTLVPAADLAIDKSIRVRESLDQLRQLSADDDIKVLSEIAKLLGLPDFTDVTASAVATQIEKARAGENHQVKLGREFAGDFDDHNDVEKTVAIVRDARSWSISVDGRVCGLVAGDMGYAATSIVIDPEHLDAFAECWLERASKKAKAKVAQPVEPVLATAELKRVYQAFKNNQLALRKQIKKPAFWEEYRRLLAELGGKAVLAGVLIEETDFAALDEFVAELINRTGE